MTLEERARVVAMLPAEVPDELQPPEGDCHRKAKSRTTDTLDDFFQRIGRKKELVTKFQSMVDGLHARAEEAELRAAAEAERATAEAERADELKINFDAEDPVEALVGAATQHPSGRVASVLYQGAEAAFLASSSIARALFCASTASSRRGCTASRCTRKRFFAHGHGAA